MFSIFESEETKRLKSHIVNLGALAKIDGHIDAAEMEHIISIGERKGMRAQDVRALLADSHNVKLTMPNNDMDRFDQIYDLVEMMLADGIVDDSEMEFCIDIATKMGFRKAVVGVLVKKITTGVKDGLSREEIKSEAISFLEL
ncbi:TerB family tellurite resistance protein [Rufibacter immobilis]|uniref:TerB family tellurite resistance protein n=1 Tax=Rufibacter immobilis TaxID=1348778 RepID=A0A3M9MPY1_9BACT|nr:TerB family tellurite resistance protein [Rufibacter immobilis]RNI27277.1 TerB family tellurite resistance protein [Rufibacter immobilis]